MKYIHSLSIYLPVFLHSLRASTESTKWFEDRKALLGPIPSTISTNWLGGVLAPLIQLSVCCRSGVYPLIPQYAGRTPPGASGTGRRPPKGRIMRLLMRIRREWEWCKRMWPPSEWTAGVWRQCRHGSGIGHGYGRSGRSRKLAVRRGNRYAPAGLDVTT